nr:hypothetical protein [Tanacetum cinerariifolium]
VILKRDDLALVVNIEFVPLIVEEDATGPLIELVRCVYGPTRKLIKICLIDFRDHTFGLGGSAWYYTHAYIEDGVTFIAISNLTFLAKDLKPNRLLKASLLVAIMKLLLSRLRITTPLNMTTIDGKGNGGMVVDSGMTYSMLPKDLYNSVVGEFGKSGNKRERGVEVKRKVGCMTLMNAGYFSGSGGRTGLLGNYQQQGLEVVYDLLNKRVGFARRKCSSLWETLG